MKQELSDHEYNFIERYRDLLPEFQKLAGKRLDELFGFQTEVIKMGIFGVEAKKAPNGPKKDDRIKPCPFCGASLEPDNDSPVWLFHPDNECILADDQVDIDGFGQLCINSLDDGEIAKWNRRVNE